MNEQAKELYTALADLGLPVQEVDDTRHYWFIRTQKTNAPISLSIR